MTLLDEINEAGGLIAYVAQQVNAKLLDQHYKATSIIYGPGLDHQEQMRKHRILTDRINYRLMKLRSTHYDALHVLPASTTQFRRRG